MTQDPEPITTEKKYDSNAAYAEQLEYERMCAEYDEMIFAGCRYD